jgi:hypothetical protein
VTQAALGQSDTVKWKYEDYMTVGSAINPSRVFQTLVRLDNATGN